MAIYFPRGFNSGEPVRVVDGVTVVRGALARQPAELVVVACARTLLGAPASGVARVALAALGAGLTQRVRALPRGSREVHELAADGVNRRWLGFVEVTDEPRAESELANVVERIAAYAAIRGAREIALAPFGTEPRAARALVQLLRTWPAGPRWIVVVRERAQFEAAGGAAAASPTSP
ncbi:MAG: hypothetical protein IPK07_18765 [Deltaproteobacteria bacterium]|jgi:hypothetical protein|nr:hypothetical protein [Deltaproteobacteria bacterium]